MDLATFAINDGFSEAICRGLRASFLTEPQYNQIKNCQTKAELKSFLEETDYNTFLVNEQNDIQVATLRNKLKQKLADEINYIETQSSQPLSTFIHLIRQKYMIDNVVNIMEGLKNKVDINVLEASADALGYFPEIRNIRVIDGDDYAGLYKDVLIDTPVGPYFMRYLEQTIDSLGENKTLNDIMGIFKEEKTEKIRTSLKKMWLENFFDFVDNNLYGSSRDLMLDILKFDADFKTIQVVYNSLGNKEQQQVEIIKQRKQLCPALGYLYPDPQRVLVKDVNSFDQLKEWVRGVEVCRRVLAEVPDPAKKDELNNQNIKSIDDVMYEEETLKYSEVFEGQSQYAMFYAYIRLKEQEIRNIVWLAEMISRKLPKNHPGWKKVVVPFQ